MQVLRPKKRRAQDDSEGESAPKAKLAVVLFPAFFNFVEQDILFRRNPGNTQV